jgi:predicted dehydrogenase
MSPAAALIPTAQPLQEIDMHSHLRSRHRRQFLRTAAHGALIAASTPLAPLAAAADAVPREEHVQLPQIEARTEPQEGSRPLPWPESERVGFAIVGLGHLSLDQLVPAFGQCQKARLVALVSGTPEKARKVAQRYGIRPQGIYDYQTFDRIADNPQVEVVYVVLPNGMHAEYTVRAAQAGKHVLCEKPMANTVGECEQMIAACREAQRKLMIAYRIQYEPNNRMVQRLVREQTYGPVKLIEAVNGQRQGDPRQWRLKRSLAGGGALPDIGLYCLNTTRYLTGEEPEEVFGQVFSTPGDARFREVEESVAFQMRFPSGILSNNITGYDVHESRRYRVHATEAWFGMDPAFSYDNLRMELSRASGPLELPEHPRQSPRNQFALEMDHMADCVRSDRTLYTPGEEGLQDQRIMAAIYESAQSGRPVRLRVPRERDAFRGPQPPV